jgi:RecA-family ATPase
MTRQLSAFVSLGLPILGRDVKQGQTLYVSTQERAGPIVDHFRTVGCTEDTMPLVIAGERFDPSTAMARLDATIADNQGIKLVVLDMICDLLPLNDSNDYTEMVRKFASLRELADKHAIHITATHHTKKAQTDNPVHSFIGSSAIAGAVDQLMCLSTDTRQQRYVTTMQRYGEALPLTLLNWDSTKRAMYLGQSAEEVKADQRKATEERIFQDLMIWVAGNPGRTREEILDSVRGDAAAKRKAFTQLRDAGQFVQAGNGQKGNPYTYKISDSSKETAAHAA